MPRRLVALVLVVLVGRTYLAAPAAGGQETATPIADAAVRSDAAWPQMDGNRPHHRQRHPGIGAGMAGAGVLLLGIAHATRGPAVPAIVIDGDRAIVQQRITF